MSYLRSQQLSWEARRALGGLLPLIDDPGLRDLFVQVPGADVWAAGMVTALGSAGSVDSADSARAAELWLDRGSGPGRVAGWSLSADGARALGVALIAAGGRHVDELSPCADVHLGAGIRVHVVLPPVCPTGAAISVRLPRLARLDFEGLVAAGLCDARTEAVLRDAVVDRKNLLLTGGTGSGKTTLLAALMGLVLPGERIVTIEDLAELQITHPHRVTLEARQANSEGVGEVGLERLMREALRMRPDRLVLGECRGAEIATLLSALNTGHDGGVSTLHASRLQDVPSRLEALGALAGLSPPALARQAVSALHLVAHLRRDRSGRHRVEALGRLELADDHLSIRPLDADTAGLHERPVDLFEAETRVRAA